MKMTSLEGREKKLAAQLTKIDAKRAKLRRELQVTRIKMAGVRRRSNSKASRAVAALLAKTDPDLYQKLATQVTGAKTKPRRRKKGG